MFRTLAYAGAFAVAIAAVGCGGDDSSSTTTKDFSMSHSDGGPTNTDGGNNDASMVAYTDATAHAIDTAVIGDALNTQGTAVKLTGMIVLAPPVGFSSKYMGTSKAGCTYEVYVSDPSCTTAPCGLVIETAVIENPNGVGQFCPYASATTTALQNTWRGDVITVSGVIDAFANTGAATDGGATGTVNQHEVVIDSIVTTTVKGDLPDALVVKDSTPSIFTPYTGSGWAAYEGTYIKLEPASGSFTTTLNKSSSFADTCTGVTGKTNGSFEAAPGGAYFADTFAAFYIQKDAGEATNCWPTDNSMFSSISAIVSAGFGGSLLPTLPDDFQP